MNLTAFFSERDMVLKKYFPSDVLKNRDPLLPVDSVRHN